MNLRCICTDGATRVLDSCSFINSLPQSRVPRPLCSRYIICLLQFTPDIEDNCHIITNVGINLIASKAYSRKQYAGTVAEAEL